MNNQEISFLVPSIKQGELSSFVGIYKMCYAKFFGFSKKFHSLILQPSDFVQQIFLKLWDEKDQLREGILLDKQLMLSVEI